MHTDSGSGPVKWSFAERPIHFRIMDRDKVAREGETERFVRVRMFMMF